MEGQIHQMSPENCRTCGMTCIMPREESYFDRRNNEIVTEAIWICHRCGTRIGSGEISRVKQDEKE